MQNKMTSVLADERIGRLLLKLSVPAFFGMFVMTLYNVVDTIFIGHYVGPLGIAGLSVVFPIQMLAMGVGQMSAMGGASLISRLLGGGNTSKAELTLGNAISSTVLLTLIVVIAGLANTDFWLKLIGASETILPYARDYLTIILCGVVFMTLSMAMNGLVRSEGNARVAMVGMIIGAVLNIILDAVFIIPLKMGIRGAALATVIAQFVSVAYFVCFYLSGKSHLKIHFTDLIPKMEVLKPIYAIGVSALAMTLAGSLSAALVNRTLVFYGGDYGVSTFGVLNRIMAFAVMPGMVIGQGLQPILGFNYGAGRYKLALRTIKIGLIWASSISSVAFVLLYFVPEVFIRIFTSDGVLVEMAGHAARRVFIVLYLLGFAFIGSLVFMAMGKALKSFVTSLARPALFLIPVLLVFSQLWGLEGVWLAFPAADLLTVVLTVILLVPEIRTLRKGAPVGSPADKRVMPGFMPPVPGPGARRLSDGPPMPPGQT